MYIEFSVHWIQYYLYWIQIDLLLMFFSQNARKSLRGFVERAGGRTRGGGRSSENTKRFLRVFVKIHIFGDLIRIIGDLIWIQIKFANFREISQNFVK